MGKLEVDQDLIRELAALLEETGLGEIEIADDKRLRVARPSTVIARRDPGRRHTDLGGSSLEYLPA